MTGSWATIFYDLEDGHRAVEALVRLTVAAALGAVLGFERQTEGKVTSARMHMIVALGCALMTFIGSQTSTADLSRVMQGLITGVGFLGAGVIMKNDNKERVHGLTTAASVWLTAAVGMAAGAGYLWAALYGVCLGWVILSLLRVTKTDGATASVDPKVDPNKRKPKK